MHLGLALLSCFLSFLEFYFHKLVLCLILFQLCKTASFQEKGSTSFCHWCLQCMKGSGWIGIMVLFYASHISFPLKNMVIFPRTIGSKMSWISLPLEPNPNVSYMSLKGLPCILVEDVELRRWSSHIVTPWSCIFNMIISSK